MKELFCGWMDKGTIADYIAHHDDCKHKVCVAAKEEQKRMVESWEKIGGTGWREPTEEETREWEAKVFPHCCCCHRDVPSRQDTDSATGDGICLECRVEHADADAGLSSDERAGCPDDDPEPKYNAQGYCVVCYE